MFLKKKLIDHITELNELWDKGSENTVRRRCREIGKQADPDIFILLLLAYEELGKLRPAVFDFLFAEYLSIVSHKIEKRIMDWISKMDPDDFDDMAFPGESWEPPDGFTDPPEIF